MIGDTRIFHFADVTVYHSKERTITLFGDKSSLTGEHRVAPDQEVTAAEYGMDPAFMNETHDLTHSILAVVLGIPESPSLASTARKHFLRDYWIEERAVLALQAYAAWRGVDLLAVAKRLELVSWVDTTMKEIVDSLDPDAPQKR